MSQSHHRSRNAQHAVRKPSVPRAERKNWRETVDHGLEIFICIGHIVGAVMLVAEHLM